MKPKKKKQLSFFEIVETGRVIENKVNEYNTKGRTEITIHVDKEDFVKIDEDMYYRQFPEGKDFQPSDNTIIVNFDSLVIFIKKKEEN